MKFMVRSAWSRCEKNLAPIFNSWIAMMSLLVLSNFSKYFLQPEVFGRWGGPASDVDVDDLHLWLVVLYRWLVLGYGKRQGLNNE